MSVGSDMLPSVWQRWLSSTLGLCLALSLWQIALGQTTPDTSTSGRTATSADSKASETKPPATAAQIQRLIEQLGAERFQEREAASASLLAIGEPALFPLTAAERGKDAEISSRAKAIRQRIERDRFEAISLKFKRDPDPTASYGLPGWKSFSKVAGASRPAKRLFLEMLNRRPTLAMCLESIDKGEVPDGVFDGMPQDPIQRLRFVAGKTCTDIRQNLFMVGQPAEAGDLVALLIVMQTLEEPGLELHESVRLLCNMGALNRLMALPGALPSGRKIMGAWFAKAPLVYGSEAFIWARLYRIQEARQLALRVIDSPSEIELKADAFMCLSMFGTPADLPVIDKYVDNAEITDEFNPSPYPGEMRIDPQGPPGNFRPQSRGGALQYRQTLGDIALMAGCKIAGMDLENLFPVIRINEGSGVLKNSVGFPIDAPNIRTNVIKAYKDHRAKNK